METDDILARSLKHNFWTWSAQRNPDVIPVEKADGVYFWEPSGKRYLDFNSMVMCVNIGHGNRTVQDAMIRQIRELTFAGPHMATEVRAALGEKLAALLPVGLDRFLYTLGGSEANENAVKLARDYTGKFKILTRYRSYHGATMGSMALSGDYRRLHWEPLTMPGVVHFEDPYPYRSPFFADGLAVDEEHFSQVYLNHLEDIIRGEGPETIAAVLIETVTGTNGILVPPQGYLQGLRALCDQYGILVITDEVMAGFGRTGKWFAFQNWDIVPDIVTMAKGVTSGYAPLGAVAMKSEIADSFNDKMYFGGLTYNGHPVSLAAALANIEVIEQEGLLENTQKRGETLKNLLAEMKTKHHCVGDVRSIGLFGAIELVRDRKTKEPLTPIAQPLTATMKKVKDYLRAHGLYINNTFHILLIIPPLIITDDQLREGFAIIDEALTLADADLQA
ncbi:MAG: aminotransferase class III-fold pyridoxal phosphate-dependent enzyme [Anaerolineaceae bacterium]|nr:aminotransferase class III-fold pyridoxal phosphate-dependent enzyme [Anaerolineaceae bacterium]